MNLSKFECGRFGCDSFCTIHLECRLTPQAKGDGEAGAKEAAKREQAERDLARRTAEQRKIDARSVHAAAAGS